MKARFEIEDPKKTVFTVSISATLEQWVELQNDLTKTEKYYGLVQTLRECLYGVTDKARKEFAYDTDERE